MTVERKGKEKRGNITKEKKKKKKKKQNVAHYACITAHRFFHFVANISLRLLVSLRYSLIPIWSGRENVRSSVNREIETSSLLERKKKREVSWMNLWRIEWTKRMETCEIKGKKRLALSLDPHAWPVKSASNPSRFCRTIGRSPCSTMVGTLQARVFLGELKLVPQLLCSESSHIVRESSSREKEWTWWLYWLPCTRRHVFTHFVGIQREMPVAMHLVRFNKGSSSFSFANFLPPHPDIIIAPRLGIARKLVESDVSFVRFDATHARNASHRSASHNQTTTNRQPKDEHAKEDLSAAVRLYY